MEVVTILRKNYLRDMELGAAIFLLEVLGRATFGTV